MAIAAASPNVYWFITRGSGVVTLILLTLTVALGVANVQRLPELARAALRDHRRAPKHIPAGGRVPRGPHHHGRARWLRADPARRRGRSVRCRLPPVLARARRDLARPDRRGDRHQPAAPTHRLPSLAGDALARLCELAGGAVAQPGNRQRRRHDVDARRHRRLRGDRRGIAAHPAVTA